MFSILLKHVSNHLSLLLNLLNLVESTCDGPLIGYSERGGGIG